MPRKTKYDYFKAFKHQTQIACQEADLLIDVIENFTTAEAMAARLPEAHELEHSGDVINHDTFTAMSTDFITPIDRDDILSLSQALDEIIDEMEDIIQLFYMMDIHFMHKDAHQLADIIKREAEALCGAMDEFVNFKKSTAFKDAIVNVNSLEEEADQLYLKLVRNLHTVDMDNPMRVLVWSRIFTKMEECTDACEHVADLMGTIILKNA